MTIPRYAALPLAQYFPRAATLLMALLLALALPGALRADDAAPTTAAAPDAPADPDAPKTTLPKPGAPTVRVVQLLGPQARNGMYRNALPSLLREIRDKTSINLDPDPVLIETFDDPVIFKHPFIYVNFADREVWEFSESEVTALRQYIERGGFIFVDAGISAEFLRRDSSLGQHHSFADWQAHPDLERAFAQVLPDKSFRPVRRSHPLFRSFYKGLPNDETLPDSIREYVRNEKWPQGTYSAVSINVKGRMAVLAMPIVAMGWGKDPLGNWSTQIGFRVRETAPALGDYLETAAYAGERFETRREEGGLDIIYCQEAATPSWVQEPGGEWRVFRYYHSREISDFAHTFFTQLGVNILVFSMTQ